MVYSVSMTKHFVLLAEIVKAAVQSSRIHTGEYGRGYKNAVDELADGLADMCEIENDRFDREWFIRACGAEPL